VNQTPFLEFFKKFPIILGEGAVIERLRRNTDFELDPFIVNSAFIYDKAKRTALETIYRQYLDIGFQYDLPLLLSTPTWRANQKRIAAAGYERRDVNGDNFRFLDALRTSYGLYAQKVVICGLLSCQGDAYNPAEALEPDAAYEFHTWQSMKLAEAGVDFFLAATLPAFGEATGLASALAVTNKPYIISFVVRPEGTLLDGTPLINAICGIDNAVTPKPTAYLVIFRSAIFNEINSSSFVRTRIVGLLANTAAVNPEELDNSAELLEEEPDAFGQSVASLHEDLGMKILGGCCGTDHRHIRYLAKQLTSYYM